MIRLKRQAANLPYNDAIADLDANTIQGAIEALDNRLDAIAQGNNSYSFTFDQTNIVNNKITINHGLNNNIVLIQVFDNLGEKIYPDRITIIDPNNIELNMTNYLPFLGNYQLKIYG